MQLVKDGGRRIQDVRAAVVGTGFVARVHVDALRRLGVEVTGMVGSTPDRGRAQAAMAHLPAYRGLEDILADRRVDVVHVASPNNLHLPQVRAALEAGKHVVCEKPLGLTADETLALLELARASGRVHATNFNLRFFAQVQEAAARVAAGELGAVRLFSGAYLQDWLLLDTDWNWRLDPEVGGALRAVGDIGSHWIDLVTFVAGRRVEAVMADLATFVPVRRQPTEGVPTFGAVRSSTVEREVWTEDAAGILVHFEGGARGVCTLSQVSPGRRNDVRFQVDGSASALAWDGERPEELWLGHRGRPNELLRRDPSLSSPQAAAHTWLPAGHAEGFADTFRALYRAVYKDVARGGPSDHPRYPTFADGHRAAVIGEAIARSAAAGRWVAVA
jgi:predicted dehydrogenase